MIIANGTSQVVNTIDTSFSDVRSLNSLSITEGNWTISHGLLQSSPESTGTHGGPFAIVLGSDEANTTAETSTTVLSAASNSTDADAIILLRYQNATNYYAFIADLKAGTAIIGREAEGTWQILAINSLPKGIEFGQSFNMTANATGNNLVMLINDNTIESATDQTFSHGLVGLATSSATVRFSSFNVTQTNGILQSDFSLASPGSFRLVVSNATETGQSNALFDGSPVALQPISPGVLESAPVSISSGYHSFSWPATPSGVISLVNASLATGAKDSAVSAQYLTPKILYNTPVSYDVVDCDTASHVLVFPESYSSLWNAYLDGVRLPHFLAQGYANGYVVPASAGCNNIHLAYDGQNQRALLILVTFSAWIVAISIVLYSRSAVLLSRIRVQRGTIHDA